MSETDTQTRAPQPLSTILGRVADPLLLFSGSLCLLLFLSWMFLLPGFIGVQRPDGVAMTPRAIAHYTRELAADLMEAEAHRTKLVRAVNDEGYRALIDARSYTLSTLELGEQLRQAAARLGGVEGGIIFSLIAIDGIHATIEGDVRAGTRSMTVLAAFMDAVAKLPIVTDLKRPAFTRETLPDGSMHSPFRFTFDLPSA